MGIISALHPTFESQRWQQFLVYIGFTLGAFVINAFLNSALPLVYRGAWPDGIAWLLGDAVVHMIEEIPNPHTEGPKVMVSCVGIGTVTGSIFLIVLLFVAGDMDKVVNSSAGPLLQILIHSTQNRAGGVCLL
ncbi:hypothetical protein LTS12_029745, partial [Elasticomyces elasticus]